MSVDTQVEPDISQRKQQEAATVSEAWEAVKKELTRFGLETVLASAKQELAREQLRRDSFDGSYSFYGEWLASSGARMGNILIHEGGQVFAEFDVALPHPTDKRWFVEGVNVWGRRGAIKAELKLLQAL